MISRWQWFLKLLSRRLWFKAGLFGLAAVATALIAALAAPLVPEGLSDAVGADSVESILDILASSMLAVATFSLGTMVAAFAAAASTATPRASKLLVEDSTSQNVLSTFVGAFIFSLVGIIALSTNIYGPDGRVILYLVTLVVIIAVLVTFFRWIDYLSNLGRLSETVGKVERAATDAMHVRWNNPHLCCMPIESIPTSVRPLAGDSFGYVQHVDVAALSDAASSADGSIYVARLPGTYTEPSQPLVWTSWRPGEDERRTIRKAFTIGSTRSFDQDPRFGLIVLSEIASRALSPGINDPGTAIDIIGRVVRVLAIWSRELEESDRVIQFPNVYVPAVRIEDMFDDVFAPIARDAAGTIEVGVRLQKALATLSRVSPTRFGAPAHRHSQMALKLSLKALQLEEHKRLLDELAARIRPPGEARTPPPDPNSLQ